MQRSQCWLTDHKRKERGEERTTDRKRTQWMGIQRIIKGSKGGGGAELMSYIIGKIGVIGCGYTFYKVILLLGYCNILK